LYCVLSFNMLFLHCSLLTFGLRCLVTWTLVRAQSSEFWRRVSWTMAAVGRDSICSVICTRFSRGARRASVMKFLDLTARERCAETDANIHVWKELSTHLCFNVCIFQPIRHSFIGLINDVPAKTLRSSQEDVTAPSSVKMVTTSHAFQALLQNCRLIYLLFVKSSVPCGHFKCRLKSHLFIQAFN